MAEPVTKQDDFTGYKLFFCLMAGTGFGIWRGSIGAALFTGSVLIILWWANDEWRERRDG